MSKLNVGETYEIDINNSNQAFILSAELRSKAAQIIASTDFPTTKTEAWKYTRVTKIKNTKFKILADFPLWRGIKGEESSNQIDKFLIPNLSGSVIVFVNGLFSSELSTIEAENGLEILPLNQDNTFKKDLGKLIPLENEIFYSLNTFYAQDGIAIRIAKNTQLKQTIQLIFISSGENTYIGNRNVIRCEDFSKAHITMNYVSLDNELAFNNTITEISVGSNAHLSVDKIQQESESMNSIISEFVQQEKDSTFSINTFTLGGDLVRNNLNIDVNGQNCETYLSGAYILKSKQHVDNHTIVDHKVAYCESNELYKGVIDDQATAVFNGKVFVRKDAQKINAFQSNGNILLSNTATINSKPELEIYADDVKCSHGSTTGQLDEEAIFYLKSRGISYKTAKKMIVGAFLEDVIKRVSNEHVQLYVNSLTNNSLKV
ncbi:MAG: Fe-S cluster assembly protein SufD [Flavobacteriia bacterium]|nr:Fe-S cluster assembly protein SufD [Flavobacteriia bacterium]